MTRPRFILFAFTAAVVLAGGLLAPGAEARRLALVQDEPKPKLIRISGIAILPDGGAAANLPVSIKKPLCIFGSDGSPSERRPPPEMLSQDGRRRTQFKTLAKAVTDSVGRFTMNLDPRDAAIVQLEIGDKAKSAWIIVPVQHKFTDVDLGELRLRGRVTE